MTHPHVVAALAAVSADVAEVAKANKSPQGYYYRGIDGVLNALHGPLSKHGVVIVPNVVERTVQPSLDGKAGWQDITATVRYTFYGPGGRDDSITCDIVAVGRDNSDKGDGKALSYAFKAMAFQVFSIPTDAAQDNEASDDRDFARPEEPPPVDERAQTLNLLRSLPEHARKVVVDEAIKRGLVGENRVPFPSYGPEQLAELRALIEWGDQGDAFDKPPGGDQGQGEATPADAPVTDPTDPVFDWPALLATAGVSHDDALALVVGEAKRKKAKDIPGAVDNWLPADLARWLAGKLDEMASAPFTTGEGK